MDANRTLRVAALIALLGLTGCTLDGQAKPTARQEKPPPEHKQKRVPPPQVVDDPETPQAGSVIETSDTESAILSYIERVDEARRRDGRHPPAQHTSQTRLVADEQPVPSDKPTSAPAEEVASTQPAPIEPPIETSDAGVNETLPPQEDITVAEPTVNPPASQPVSVSAPKLAEVRVRAVHDFEPRQQPDESPGINNPAAAAVGPRTLPELLEQLPPPDDDSFSEQVRWRMMWALAGEYERARAPLKLVTAEQQALALRFVEAWILLQEAHMGDLSEAANAISAELERLQEALRKLNDLSISKLRICSAVYGFGQYDLIEPPRFVAGTSPEFVLYCQLRDFVSELRDDGYYHTQFDMTTTILDRAGDVADEIRDLDIIDRCRDRRHDCFIPRLIRLPSGLPPGQYVAKVSVVDKLGRKVAEERATFEVVARP